jgi:hypothetical protein
LPSVSDHEIGIADNQSSCRQSRNAHQNPKKTGNDSERRDARHPYQDEPANAAWPRRRWHGGTLHHQ